MKKILSLFILLCSVMFMLSFGGGAAMGVAPVPLLVLPPIFALTMTLNKKHFYLGNDKKKLMNYMWTMEIIYYLLFCYFENIFLGIL